MEDVDSFILNKEDDLLYGSIYISASELSDLQQESLDLRS